MTENDIKVIVDPKLLTVGDLLDIEDITGEKMGSLGDDERPASANSILAMAYVSARRKDPAITLEIVRTWRMDQIEFAGQNDDEDEGEATDPS